MRIPRIFVTRRPKPGQTLRLKPGPSRHLLRVLRLRPGDPLTLFDGDGGGEYESHLVSSEEGFATVTVDTHRKVNRESPLRLSLLQGLSRGGRMELVIQKAVELGVAGIVPVQTTRSVPQMNAKRAEKRLRRWREIAISAAEQSGRTRLPALASVRPLGDVLRNIQFDEGDLALVLDPESRHTLGNIRRPAAAVTLLVGPEGGLDNQEIAAARAAGFAGLRMGPRVLRTETAGLACLAALQTLWGDLG